MIVLEFVWTTVSSLLFLAAVFGHKLKSDWANLIFAALTLTLLKVIHALVHVVVICCGLIAAVGVSGSQKGLHAKCRIYLAWLIKHQLLCRLHQSVIAMYCRWPFLGRYPSQCGVREERVECIILLFLLNLLCRPSSQVVADFGCGEALIAQSITNKVYSFDLIAKNTFVTACNMAKVSFQFYFILGKGYQFKPVKTL